MKRKTRKTTLCAACGTPEKWHSQALLAAHRRRAHTEQYHRQLKHLAHLFERQQKERT